jgi:myb proto-oncogene protein
MKHIFVAISMAFLGASPVLALDEGEMSGRRKAVLFSPEEDARLRELVERMGARNWNVISQWMPNRNAYACRNHWRNYLDPIINHSPWTSAEDQLLIKKIQELGPHWAQIAKFFNGRTDMHLKNRFRFLNRHAIRLARSGLLATPTNVEEQGGVILGDSELWAQLGVNF